MASAALLDGGLMVPVTRLSTSHLAEADRYAAWRGASATGPLYQTQPYEPFDVTTDMVALGSLNLIFTDITGQDFERTAAMTRADGVDDLVISVRFRGGARGDLNGMAIDAPDGSVMVADMAQPQRHRSDPSHSAYISIPRALAEEFVPSVRALHGLVIAPENAVLLREHLLQIWRNAAALPAAQGPRLAGTVLDLLAVAVAQQQGQHAAVPAETTAAHLRARAAIEARLGSATLTVASLCRTLGMSRSALYRMFDAEDGVHAYITRRRLECVAEALRDPACHDRIGDIAERWGFCDAAYLGRVFRQRFGMTPGAFREFSRGRM